MNLLTRLSELTRTTISRDEHGQPNTWVVRLTDDALFDLPIAIVSDTGTIGFTSEEGERLRAYLLKGGFLWADDFWARRPGRIGRRRSAACFHVMTTPSSKSCRTIRSSGASFRWPKCRRSRTFSFWRSVGGRTTSERGSDSAQAHFRVIRDGRGRIMVVMTHNTDIADSWEREGEDPGFFQQFSPDGYAFGINVILHATTH